MKFAIYQTPGTNLQIRCIDGEFTVINPGHYSNFYPGTSAHWNAILTAPGTPAPAEAIKKLKVSGSLCTYSRSIAKMLYSVPDGVELYERGDFGVEAPKATKTERLQVRLTPDMKEKLSKKAESEGRTVSNYIEQLIKRDLEKSE